MGQKVTFVVDAQQKAAIDAFLQIGAAVDAVAAKGHRAGKTMAQGGEEAGTAWEKGLRILSSYPMALGKMLTGAAGVYAALGQIRAEFERMGQLQEKAMTGLDQTQDPYNRLKQSASTEYAKSDHMQQMIRKGMQAMGAENPADYLNLAANMMSARQGMSEVKAMEAANVTAALVGRMGMPAEDAADLGGAVLDAINIQGTHGKNYTPKQMLGKMMSMYGVTRSTTMGDFARYDMRTVNTLARHGWSIDAAIASQGAVAGAKPDVHGRITSTMHGVMAADLSEAYANAVADRYGIPGMSPQDFEKSGEKMIEISRSNTKTGHYINAWMFGGLARHPAARKLSERLFGRKHMGHARGEAGVPELMREYLDPNEELYNTVQTEKSRIVSDANAEKRYDEVMAVGNNALERYYAGRAAERGGVAVGRFNQIDQATRGGVVSTQKEFADMLATTAFGQAITGAITSLKASGARGDELREQELEIYSGAIGTLRGRAAMRAARQQGGGMFGALEGGVSVTPEQAAGAMTADERQLIETLKLLIETLKSQKVEVTVQDSTGREVGRSTSRPRDVNGLSSGAGSNW